MTNSEIANLFEEVANLLEFQGENPFRVRAYRSGARTLRDLSQSLESLVAAEADLTQLPGIGKDLAAKCLTLLESGRLPLLDELKSKIPASVLELLRVPGLGPRKAALLHKELGIQSLEDLQAACDAGRVRTLKGFGAKTEQSIKDGIPFARSVGDRIYWADADSLAQKLKTYLQASSSVERLELAGSYRRGRETVGDLDLLVVSGQPAEVMDRLAAFSDTQDVLLRGDTKMSVRLASRLQADLRVVPAASFGAAWQYFTGSKEHNVILRGRAKQLGLKVNEYGVFRGDDPQPLAGATEEEVYAAIGGLPCIPPELREGREEFDWADAGCLPDLITRQDIRGDLHMHTTESDGQHSLREMALAAQEQGLSYIAITDHSQRVSMARGLNSQRLRAQWRAIEDLNAELGDAFTVLKGVECDILEQGGMDLPDDVLAEADWVIASIHYGQKQSRRQITERILGALENPHVDMLAHPTGRLINQREAYDVDLDAVFQAAKKHRKMLELNAHPARLDLHDLHCAAAKKHGIPIVINTDAHSRDQLSALRYGILQARRGGLTRQDVANTRSLTAGRKLSWP